MKKTVFCVVVISVILLCSCSSGVGMAEILAYQPGDFTARIADAENGEFSAVLTKRGGEVTLEFTAPVELEGVRYEKTGEGLFVCAGEMKIKLDGEFGRVEKIFGCFSLDAGGGWKISAVKLGGADVYKCSTNDTVAYFDKNTFCPYRIENRGVKIDVLSFDGIKTKAAE